jgi:hypothetical protein
MFLCCNHANVLMFCPDGFWVNTCMLQLLLTELVGPQSSIDTTIKPTSQRMNSRNAPIMTMDGRRRFW